MNEFDYTKQFESIKTSTINTLNTIFPLEGRTHIIKANKVWADDKLDYTDYESQKKAKLNDKTWGIPVYADLTLIDKLTNKQIDREPRVRLFTLPKFTTRASFIVRGNEYQFKNQLRLRPGVYTTRTQTDEIASMVNTGKGKNFDISLDPKNGVFSVNIDAGESKLYPLLKTIGVSDKQMENLWGKEIYQANTIIKPEDIKKEVTKIVKSFKLPVSDSLETMKDGLLEYFKNASLHKESTKVTLGKEFDHVNPSLLLETSNKLLKVYKGQDEPDDRNSLMFKELHSIEDFLTERLTKNKNKLLFKIKRGLDSKNKIADIISLKSFNDVVEQEFIGSGHAGLTDQTNPIGMMGEAKHVTITGEGGISNTQKITDEMRSLHPSHFGFLDPVHTPEGEHIGATLRLAMGAAKDGKTIKTHLYNVKTGKDELVDPIKMYNLIVGMPDQFIFENGKLRWVADKVLAFSEGKTVNVPSKEITHVILKTNNLFSNTSNLIPFMQNDHGNRVMMASKQMEQALPLKYREEPLVKPVMGQHGSMYDILGKAFSAASPVDGVVTQTTDNKIIVTGKDKKKHQINIYNQFPLNMKTFIDSDTVVKKGDNVKAGQLLADTNYTKNGILAQGVNLRTALIPYKGYNFEDGVVITESAAKKLTSEHIYQNEADLGKNSTLNLNKFKIMYPTAYKPDVYTKFDEDGVIKKGSIVNYKDPLILILKKDTEDEEDLILGKLRKSFIKPLKNRAIDWDREVSGKVIDVVKTAKAVKVYVQTEEPATKKTLLLYL